MTVTRLGGTGTIAEQRLDRTGYQVALTLIFAVGLALRLWNANTAQVHDDEHHAVSDAFWLIAPVGLSEGLAFLRNHPRDHFKLDLARGITDRWGDRQGEIARLGHPCFYEIVTGLALGVTRPSDLGSAVSTGRTVNAVADASAILLLPSLALALGATAPVGLASAGLYAVFPPAVTYGSIANLDPLLAPFMVLLCLILARHDGLARSWLQAGIVTGLLLSTKQTGLVALILVPVAGTLLAGWSLRGLATWATSAFVVFTLFTNPVAYAHSILYPVQPFGGVRLDPAGRIAGNLAYAAQPSRYYWLSFRHHGQPLAPLLARVHRVLTPAYLAAYVISLLVTLAHRQGARLLLLFVPTLALLALIEPSSGLWRFQMVLPLVCVAAASGVAGVPRRWRVPVLGVLVAASLWVLLPERPGRDGRLDLGELLLMNPQARQVPSYYGFRPLSVQLASDVVLARRVWLPPRRYRVSVKASTPATIELDGRPVLDGSTAAAEIDLTGWFHRLTLALPAGGTLMEVSITATDHPS